MTTLIIHDPDSDLRFQDYIDIVNRAGLDYEAAQVHTDSKTVWFREATYDGVDLGSAPEDEWSEKGFFLALTQRARDFLRAKYDLPPAVNNDVVVPTRRLPAGGMGFSELTKESFVGRDDALYLDASKFG
jgi:hypothetical protein